MLEPQTLNKREDYLNTQPVEPYYILKLTYHKQKSYTSTAK